MKLTTLKLSALAICGLLLSPQQAHSEISDYIVVVSKDLGVSKFSELEGATACLANEVDRSEVAYLASSIYRIIFIYAYPPDEQFRASTERRLKETFGWRPDLTNSQVFQYFQAGLCDIFISKKSERESFEKEYDADPNLMILP